MEQTGQTAQALRDAEDRLRNIKVRVETFVHELRDEIEALRRIRHSLEHGPPQPRGAKIEQGEGAAQKAVDFLRSQGRKLPWEDETSSTDDEADASG
jgi:hypothetical protein